MQPCRLVTRLQPWAGMRHLDVAGGTGDVAFRVLRALQGDRARRQEEAGLPEEGVPLGEVHVCDINPNMLAEGRRKAGRAAGLGAPSPRCLLLAALRVASPLAASHAAMKHAGAHCQRSDMAW